MIKEERDSNLELLRIISMMIIIFAHYAGHGGLIDNTDGANHILGLLFKTGGKIGVVCFVLISTFFMSKQKFRFESLIKTIFQAIFYSFLVQGILAVGGHNIKLSSLAGAVLCVVSGLYWFVTAYTGLYIFQPILKRCTDSLSEKQSSSFILIMFVVLNIFAFPFGINGFIASNFVYFIYLFFIGNHLRSYSLKIRCIDRFPAAIFVITLVCIVGGTCILEYVLKYIGMIANDRAFILYELNSPLVLIGGISLFWLFKKMPAFKNKIINRLASNMFGVYLLHDNPNLRSFLWHDILKNESVYDKSMLIIILHAILCAIIIITAASCIELVRKIIEKLLFDSDAVKNLCDRFNRWYVQD